MAITKYHLKDDGTPGVCGAVTLDACPKSRAGDSFHGTLEEATQESERRFEEIHGEVAPAQSSKPSATPEGPSYAAIHSALMGHNFNSRETLADRIASGDYPAPDSPLANEGPYSRLAFELKYSASAEDRDYILNEVPVEELAAFTGEHKGLGGGALKGLVRVHRDLKSRHDRLKSLGFSQNRIPKDVRDEQISSGTGIGSLRPWGQPSNSIQNINRDTAEMLSHYVIERYGVRQAESFWSRASQRTTANRPTIAQVFKTIREFDKELKLKR